ncbi:MAG: insulinase family protein [Bdellovibrionales bacterium]|nr:insulinase family protein [Bdellovibrionales bacterium]
MNKPLTILAAMMFSVQVMGQVKAPSIEDNIKRLNWNGIDVVFIEDNRFPTFDMTLYFADGALSDPAGQAGLSIHSFNLMDSGTDKLSQSEILDQLEFLGTDFSADVTHEYTTVTVSGLTKDLKISMGQICSLMRGANYPDGVIKKELDLERAGVQSLIASPQALSERIFREVSMGGTPYSYPVAGKLKDLKNLNSKDLRARLDYFLDKVKKRVYLTGPKSALAMEKILKDDCHFKGSPDDYVRSVEAPKKKKYKTEFVFVPVPDANQVQLRIGRFLNFDETSERNLDALASDFLGGGFTSRLMREVRVKRGLTYSIGSFISSQKQYGRAGVSTFTKNQTIDSLIQVIDETVTKIEKVGIAADDLARSTEGMVGAYPFKFENNSAFLAQLLLLDHIGKPYSDLFDFKDAVTKYNAKDVAKKIGDIFSMKKQVIFVLGDKSIQPKLKALTKKYGPLKVLDYKPYL